MHFGLSVLYIFCFAGTALVAFWLVLPAFLNAIRIFTKKPKTITPAIEKQHFWVIVTAYESLQPSLPMLHFFNKENTYAPLKVSIVADKCTREDFSDYENLPPHIEILFPENALNSKVLSLRYALEKSAFAKESPAAVCVLDADNVPEQHFFAVLNNFWAQNFAVVQGRRVAKNLDTPIACADALGEIYKNYIERWIPFRLGSSASIAGSGMLVDFALFKAFLYDKIIQEKLDENGVVAAEDKLLQNFVVAQNKRIAFAWEAVVLDEKIRSGKQVQRQRTRWLFAYFENTQTARKLLWQGVKNVSANQFVFALLSLIPPMFLLFLGGMFMFLLNTIFHFYPLAAISVAAVFIFVFHIFFSLYASEAPKAIWRNIWILPLFVVKQFWAFWQMKKAKSDFLTTKH